MTQQIPPNLAITKSFRAYYPPAEVISLIRLHSVAKNSDGSRKQFSEGRVESLRQLACGYIERVGSRLGFPRRTIATAQTLYHRFHLHFNLKDFSYPDVSVAAILVASKLEDTLKKLREIQVAGWQILNMLEGGPGTGEGDVIAQESHRPQLISIERLILQTICFNFNLHPPPVTILTSDTCISISSSSTSNKSFDVGVSPRDVFSWTMRLGRALGASKAFVFLSHLLSIDVHRTVIPLSYPPHTIASACLYLASFLTPGHENCLKWKSSGGGGGGEDVEITDAESVVVGPTFEEGWNEKFESEMEHVEEIAHSLLNLFINLHPLPPSNSLSSFSNPSPSFSPLSLTSPADPSSRSNPAGSAQSEKEKHLLQTGVPHTLSGQAPVSARREEEFTRIKIRLREISRERGAKRELEKEEGAEEGRVRKWRKGVPDRRAGESEEGKGNNGEVGSNGGGTAVEEREREKPGSVRYRF